MELEMIRLLLIALIVVAVLMLAAGKWTVDGAKHLALG
jgi:hypothetical protein